MILEARARFPQLPQLSDPDALEEECPVIYTSWRYLVKLYNARNNAIKYLKNDKSKLHVMNLLFQDARDLARKSEEFINKGWYPECEDDLQTIQRFCTNLAIYLHQKYNAI